MKNRTTAPIFVLCLFLAASMRVAEAAATNPPKVVFVGDWITCNWTNIAANPDWTNDGLPGDFPWMGDSAGVLAAFQSDVISLHPQIVHIMVGAGDESGNDDASRSLIMPGLLENLEAMVQEAKAANIKVILGLEPLALGSINPMNAHIAAYGAANNIPVINYADALCNCVLAHRPLLSPSVRAA